MGIMTDMFRPCSLFQEGCIYDSDCFRRLIYTSEATRLPNMMVLRPICQKDINHPFNQLPFWRFFDVLFYLYSLQYHYLVNT